MKIHLDLYSHKNFLNNIYIGTQLLRKCTFWTYTLIYCIKCFFKKKIRLKSTDKVLQFYDERGTKIWRIWINI